MTIASISGPQLQAGRELCSTRDPQGRPILLRVETRAGHGQGMPTTKLIDEVVDMYAFALQAFGMAH